jgi:hypothetical protein
MALLSFGSLLLAQRRYRTVHPNGLLKGSACITGRVQEQYAPWLASGTLPSVRYTSRHERACSGTADCDLIANHESDFAAKDVSDLIAAMMDVQVGNGVGRRNFLEHHHALGDVTRDLERG